MKLRHCLFVSTFLFGVSTSTVFADPPAEPPEFRRPSGGGGDPHFLMWDLTGYDYHGGCDLVLINNPGFSEGLGLNLHIRTRPMGGWSGITNAALQIGSDVLEVVNNGTYSWNHFPNLFGPEPSPGDMSFGPYDVTVTSADTNAGVMTTYEIDLKRNTQKIIMEAWNNIVNIVVDGKARDFEESSGLHGTWTNPGFTGRDNETDFPDADAFGAEWQVQASDPQIFDTTPSPQHPEPCIPPEPIQQILPREQAVAVCEHLRNFAEIFENCIFDVMSTGSEMMAENNFFNEALSAACGGDPHFHTFHGEYFAYHGVCDLVMIQSPSFGNGLGLDVHIRTEEREGYSSISNAAVRIGADVLEVLKDGTHYVNGVLGVVLPTKLASTYHVTKKTDIELNSDMFLPDVNHGFTETELVESSIFDVNLGGGEHIQIMVWKDYVWVNVEGGRLNFKDTVGLMGTWEKPGFIARDGVANLEDPDEFGQEWQVLGNEPKLFQSHRHPQHPAKCLPAPKALVGRRLGQEKHAEEACAHVQGPLKEFCVFDVLATGDDEIAKVYGI